jgi:hypothetical protein
MKIIIAGHYVLIIYRRMALFVVAKQPMEVQG